MGHQIPHSLLHMVGYIERKIWGIFQIFPSPNLREKHLNCQAYTSFRLLGRENTLGKELTRRKVKKL